MRVRGNCTLEVVKLLRQEGRRELAVNARVVKADGSTSKIHFFLLTRHGDGWKDKQQNFYPVVRMSS